MFDSDKVYFTSTEFLLLSRFLRFHSNVNPIEINLRGHQGSRSFRRDRKEIEQAFMI